MELRTPKVSDCGGQWDLITELTQDWGKRLLEGTNKTWCAPGPGRKEQEPPPPPQGTDTDLPMSVQETLAEVWVGSVLLQGRGH